MKKRMLMTLCIMIVFAVSSISPVIASKSGELKTDAWYVFNVNPFTADVIHLNTNPGGWLNGYLDVFGVHHPVLGKSEGGKAYFAVDGLDTYYTLVFYVINIATRDGYIYRITDDMSLVGPTYVWLTTAASQSAEGVSALDEATGAQVTPDAWYYFNLNPFANDFWVSTANMPWLWGYDATYTDDLLLGYRQGNRFFFAWDFNEGDWYYELGFMAGTISTRDGYIQRTVDGMSYAYDDFWL